MCCQRSTNERGMERPCRHLFYPCGRPNSHLGQPRDNLMHTIPFALRGTSFPKRIKQTSEKAKPSRKRQWAVFGRSGIAAEQNDCVVVACRSNEHAASVRLLAYTENPSGVLGFHVLSNHFFPLTATAFSNTIRPQTTKTDGKVVKRIEIGCKEVRNKW